MSDDVVEHATPTTAKKPARKRKRRKKPSARSATVQSFQLSTTALSLVHPDPAKQRALAGYLTHGTVAGACAVARVDRTTWYRWLEADAEFKALAADAHEVVVDKLEDVAQKRAIKGSDTLLIFLLKAHRRGKFGDRQTITIVSPEVQVALRSTLELVASRPTWDSSELLGLMEPFWK